jgi:hypothetical protein
MESKHPRTILSAALWSLACSLAAATFGGCLKAESPAGPEQDMEQTEVLEPVRIAGATSSTNWPDGLDGGRTAITVHGRADSLLSIDFMTLRDQDPGYTPTSIDGKYILYDGNGVPALAPVDSVMEIFHGKSTLTIPFSRVEELPRYGRDTLGLSIRIVSDTLECLIAGFYYSLSQRTFIHSPFSTNPQSSYHLHSPRDSFKAELDTVGVSALLDRTQPGLELSFYIPGSSYHWSLGSNYSIALGPIPKGPYPLRLIRRALTADSASALVEIYEVVVTKRVISIFGQPEKPAYFKIGAKLLGQEMVPPRSLRPSAP